MSDPENTTLCSFSLNNITPTELFDRVDDVAEKMLEYPQVKSPVIHRFAPGLYIREVSLPAGAFVIGHEHKTEHFNVMLKGHLIMVNKDGSSTEIKAGYSYTAPPGRKIVYIIEDTVWLNVFPADETDIDVLEDRLLNKSDRFKLTEKQAIAAARVEHEADRFDYASVLEEFGMTEEFARKTAENEDDQIPMPGAVHPYRLASSSIEGVGYFLTLEAKKGVILAPANIDGKRTPAGRYVNHSLKPNAEMRFAADGNIYLVAIKDIDGCLGGGVGTEITIDYGRTLQLMASRSGGEGLCQQYIQQ